jgi:hypothetical protein
MATPNSSRNLLLLIVAVLAAGLIGWMVFTAQRDDGDAPQPAPTATPTSNGEYDEVPTDWQIFRDDERRVEFRYPQDWQITETEAEGKVLTNFLFPEEMGTQLREGQIKATLRFQDNPQNLSPEQWAEQRRGPVQEVLEREELQVGGQSAYREQVRTELGTQQQNVYVSHQGRMGLISWMGTGHDLALQQILNSVRFLER